MFVIQARNVCEALPIGINYLKANGIVESSRAGKVIVAPGPVTTVYEYPVERVLFSPVRDANPFFHLFESLWMLAGREDAAFLNQFIRDFGERFAEPDGRIHDAYGRRWLHHFGQDQLQSIIQTLKGDPESRQAVLQMWDPFSDLGVLDLKTRPCNVTAFFRINAGRLDMTVCCRSNDIIYGAYGANAVHFSVLQEYLAAAIGVEMGWYWQVSNNYHAYVNLFEKYADVNLNDNRYPLIDTTPLVNNSQTFLKEVDALLLHGFPVYQNRFLAETAWPMWRTFLAKDNIHPIAARDWRMASEEWITRRKK